MTTLVSGMADGPFVDAGAIDYPIIDADAHVNEPPELWETRLPAALRDRGPKLVHAEAGDQWHFGPGKIMRLSTTANAGMSPVQMSTLGGRRYADIRPGSFDPKARLTELDLDGVAAQVLYPSVCLVTLQHYDDPVLQSACVRAYNEWLADFCGEGEGRLFGTAILPTSNIDDVMVELDWAANHKDTIRSVMLSAFPNGTTSPDPVDERFWHAVVDAELPVAIHVGSFSRVIPNPAAASRDNPYFVSKIAASTAGTDIVPVILDMLFSRVFEDHPGLKLTLVEAQIGWIPNMLEQADDVFLRYRWATGMAEQMTSTLPSTLFHRNVWATFLPEFIGLELRHHLNLDHVMWSTDYPHSVSTWPDSRRGITAYFRGLPQSEVKKMLHDNARALYHLDHLPLHISPQG